MLATAPYAWEKHYPKDIDWNTHFTGKPLYTLLEEAAKRWPNNVAYDFMGKTGTYAELMEQVNRLAGGFQRLGVGRGTRVGLLLPNCPYYLMAYYALLKAGATVVNFNPLYSTHEVAHQLTDADVEIMVTVNLKITYDKLVPFIGKGKFRKIVVGHFEKVLPFPKSLLFPLAKGKEIAKYPSDAHHITIQALLASPPISEVPAIDPETSIAVLQYTGGTTGVPKGACLTHSNLHINTQQCVSWMAGLEPGKEKLLAVLPFFHVFAMTAALNMAIANGMTIIIHPRFELKKVLHDIDKKKPTLLPGVSTLYAAINNSKGLEKYDLSSIKICVSGGGPLPVEVKEKFEKLTGCKLVEGYGLSEASPVTHCTPLFALQKTGSIGLPLPGTTAEIVDKDDKTTVLPPGEIGEVCIRGPQVMQGYLNKPEETAAVLREGRLYTGDLGKMDEDGYFYIVDRLKEMIIVGGYNVYPRNVEEVLYGHPAIAEAAVLGLAHPTRGQMIKAYIVLKEGQTLDEATLKPYLKERMSAYAVPHAYEFRSSLPKSMIGKILKKELLAEEKSRGNA